MIQTLIFKFLSNFIATFPGLGKFVPSLLTPALQKFEGIEFGGMAMKAGLRPGDYLLQVNGKDVRQAPHNHVLSLIQSSGDTVALKVLFNLMTFIFKILH